MAAGACLGLALTLTLTLTSALEEYDKGASMQRAFPDAELTDELPALEGFAAMATCATFASNPGLAGRAPCRPASHILTRVSLALGRLEVIDVMEAVLSVMVKLMRAEGDGRL